MKVSTTLQNTMKDVAPILTLRTKLRWQKIRSLDENIMQETKAELAGAYSKRAANWRKSADAIGDEINEKCNPMRSPIGYDPYFIEVTIPRAQEKFSLLRAAVNSVNAAKLYHETREFSKEGEALEAAAQDRRGVAIYARWEITSKSNNKLAAVYKLKAADAYHKSGNGEKAHNS